MEQTSKESLTQKMQSLTPEQLAQVEHLIDSLQALDLEHACMSLSEPALAAVWNDPENDVYDEL